MSLPKLWRRDKSSIHRWGLFATEDIKKGTRIIEYKGRKITRAEGERLLERDASYIFGIDKAFDLDGRPQWNPAGYINFSHNPNCKYRQSRADKRIWLYAIRDIKFGEEFTYQYDYGFEEGLNYKCNCGAMDCPGVMISTKDFTKLSKLLVTLSESNLAKTSAFFTGLFK
jgi:SET domain-containing protein